MWVDPIRVVYVLVHNFGHVQGGCIIPPSSRKEIIIFRDYKCICVTFINVENLSSCPAYCYEQADYSCIIDMIRAVDKCIVLDCHLPLHCLWMISIDFITLKYVHILACTVQFNSIHKIVPSGFLEIFSPNEQNIYQQHGGWSNIFDLFCYASDCNLMRVGFLGDTRWPK